MIKDSGSNPTQILVDGGMTASEVWPPDDRQWGITATWPPNDRLWGMTARWPLVMYDRQMTADEVWPLVRYYD